jgi:hypothetical protein
MVISKTNSQRAVRLVGEGRWDVVGGDYPEALTALGNLSKLYDMGLLTEDQFRDLLSIILGRFVTSTVELQLGQALSGYFNKYRS